jgi:hypothetical protein
MRVRLKSVGSQNASFFQTRKLAGEAVVTQGLRPVGWVERQQLWLFMGSEAVFILYFECSEGSAAHGALEIEKQSGSQRGWRTAVKATRPSPQKPSIPQFR